MKPIILLTSSEPWILCFEGDQFTFLELLVKATVKVVQDDTIFIIDCQKSRDLDGLYDQLTEVLSLPHYFGRNFNALDECLNDLDWLDRDFYVLLFVNSVELLTDEPEDVFCGFIKILENTGLEWSKSVNSNEQWSRSARPFHSVFLENPESINIIKERYSNAGNFVGIIEP